MIDNRKLKHLKIRKGQCRLFPEGKKCDKCDKCNPVSLKQAMDTIAKQLAYYMVYGETQ